MSKVLKVTKDNFFKDLEDPEGKLFILELSDNDQDNDPDQEEPEPEPYLGDGKFPEDLTMALAESIVPGNAGIQGYRFTGIATNKDRNQEYRPYYARGSGRDFGIYHQAYLESIPFNKAIGKIMEGLTTSHWYIKPVTCDDPEHQMLASRQAQLVSDVLFNIDGGWTRHVEEALYMLVAGFAPFIRTYDGNGQLAGLEFRFPSQVYRWLCDENQARILGIEFYDGSDGGSTTYEKAASELLLYQFRALGNDWEGVPPLRTAYKAIQAQKLFSQLEAVAAEKYGAPIAFIERPDGSYDAVDDAYLLSVVDNMVATDNPIILLPGGYKITLTSPSGQMPDFEPIKRYYDEQIASLLTAEGSLLGLNGKGSYNMADIKDDQQLRSLAYYAKCICEVINGKGRLAYTGVIRDIVLGLPELNYPIVEGHYPTLEWSLAPEQDMDNLDQILNAFERGILTKTPEDEKWIRERLKIPQVVVNNLDIKPSETEGL